MMTTDRLLVYEFQSRKLDGSGWVTEWVTFVAQSAVRDFLQWVSETNELAAENPDAFRVRRSADLPDYTFDLERGLRRVGQQ